MTWVESSEPLPINVDLVSTSETEVEGKGRTSCLAVKGTRGYFRFEEEEAERTYHSSLAFEERSSEMLLFSTSLVVDLAGGREKWDEQRTPPGGHSTSSSLWASSTCPILSAACPVTLHLAGRRGTYTLAHYTVCSKDAFEEVLLDIVAAHWPSRVLSAAVRASGEGALTCGKGGRGDRVESSRCWIERGRSGAVTVRWP